MMSARMLAWALGWLKGGCSSRSAPGPHRCPPEALAGSSREGQSGSSNACILLFASFSLCYCNQLVNINKGKKAKGGRALWDGHLGNTTRKLQLHTAHPSKEMSTLPSPIWYWELPEEGGKQGPGGSGGHRSCTEVRVRRGGLPVSLAWGTVGWLGGGPHQKLTKSWKVDWLARGSSWLKFPDESPQSALSGSVSHTRLCVRMFSLHSHVASAAAGPTARQTGTREAALCVPMERSSGSGLDPGPADGTAGLLPPGERGRWDLGREPP